MKRGLPSRKARPLTVAAMPRPATARTSVAVGTGLCSWAASCVTALPSGCSLPDWMAALQASRSPRLMWCGASATSCGLPSVSVPVLSKATSVMRCATSSASASLIKMPCRAATPVPAMMAVGVASPSAQGQAITSTATALRMATSQSPAAKPQPSSVSSAMPNTTGTNTALTWSTSR